MTTIKLPKPFNSIIHKEYKNKGYKILEAYIDEMENPNLNNGLKGIRQLLGLSGNESICDLFCKIGFKDGSVKYFIFEDKNSKHQRCVYKKKKQLERSNELIKKKLGINIDFAVMSRISMEKPFYARTEFNMPFKVVRLKYGNKDEQVKLEKSNVPLLCC